MFIERLSIRTNDSSPQTIRDIHFHKGVNLIIDETSIEDQLVSGNSVGKTSVLRLVDYCLGADSKAVFKVERRDPSENVNVRDFLTRHKVSVELVLAYRDERHILWRSFAPVDKVSYRIDGEVLESDKAYRKALDRLLYPGKPDKPTLRQLVPRHIRYVEPGMDSTILTLHSSTKDDEYEAILFYMLGIDNCSSAEPLSKLTASLNVEKTQMKMLTEKHSRNDFVLMLDAVVRDIASLEKEKDAFGLDPDTASDISELDRVKREINSHSSRIARLNLRLSVIEDAIRTIDGEITNIDMETLRVIFEDTKSLVSTSLPAFDELVRYHNGLAANRKRYLADQIPSLREELETVNRSLDSLLAVEAELKSRIRRKDFYAEIGDLITCLNEKYNRKGQIENQLELIGETEERIRDIEDKIAALRNEREAGSLKDSIAERVKEFNRIFTSVSNQLYGEEYALSFDDPGNSKTHSYRFKVISMDNFSTGKKQGEVICFDMSYILYADEHSIPCLHFLMNDKKELMHNNPLRMIARFVANKDIQLVFPILKDKVPEELLDDEHVILRLSCSDKLFRIEAIDSDQDSLFPVS